MATEILVGDKVYRESDPRLRPDRGHQVQCLRPDQVVQQLARDGRSGPRASEGPPQAVDPRGVTVQSRTKQVRRLVR
jgi:hypothetical protein